MTSKQASPLHLQIRYASKSYNGIPALINAELDLIGGEALGLIGENGAGKSTFIKLLAGLEIPDTMNIRHNGFPVSIMDSSTAYRFGFRFIHQELNIVPALTVAENMFINNPLPRIAGLFVNWSQVFRKAEKALQQLGITHIDVSKRASALSSGDAMLVKIASAFIEDDSYKGESEKHLIYVMDEPTSSLNNAEVELLFEVIVRLRQRGHAVLYVTHRLDELFRIAQRVTVMRDGQVINTHQIEDTTANELIQEMTGRKVTQVFPPRESDISSNVRLDVNNLQTDSVTLATFEIFGGEIVGVAGLNGSGRSELLYALFGIDPIEDGSFALDNEVLHKLSPTTSWQSGIAYVPEERRSQGLFLGDQVSHNMTVPHLDRLSLLNSFLNQSKENSISRQLSHAVRLKGTGIRQRVRQLSGGNQQKILFARSIVETPRLVLLDEPTRGVDVGAKYDIYQLIRELSAQNTSILMVSSDLSELIGLCDRILIMRHGRIVDDIDSNGLTENQLLSLCYDV